MLLSACVPIVALITPTLGQTLNPKDDPNNPLKYIASNTLTGVAFAIVVLIALAQTFYTWRYGARWMLAMVIGGYAYAIGFGFRFGLHYHPDSKGIYIAEYLFIVLSPCAFIAADYILLGRLARQISCTNHLPIPVHRLAQIFVSSDITTFLIQATGGSLSTSLNYNMVETGSHIFLAGLALQMVSFSIFIVVYVRFLYRVYTLERDVWECDKGLAWYRDWRALAGALALSCIGILIRSCYRVAESSQGFDGHLATTEWFFYVFDTLPLVVATSIYAVFWPAWFIAPNAETEPKLA